MCNCAIITGHTYVSTDFRQNPIGYHRLIVAVTISVDKRFSSQTDLPSARRSNTTQRNPKLRDIRVKHCLVYRIITIVLIIIYVFQNFCSPFNLVKVKQLIGNSNYYLALRNKQTTLSAAECTRVYVKR